MTRWISNNPRIQPSLLHRPRSALVFSSPFRPALEGNGRTQSLIVPIFVEVRTPRGMKAMSVRRSGSIDLTWWGEGISEWSREEAR